MNNNWSAMKQCLHLQSVASADDCRVLALASQVEQVVSVLQLACSLCQVFSITAYGLESPKNRLGGSHAKGTGHPDKMTVRGGAGIMQVEHTADCFGGAWLKSPLSTEV